jgi:hypothetical protein
MPLKVVKAKAASSKVMAALMQARNVRHMKKAAG